MTEGKIALVTGGAQGIGFGIAEVLAGDGYDVAIFDLNARCGRSGGRTADGRWRPAAAPSRCAAT